jgi:hypothetical protein
MTKYNREILADCPQWYTPSNNLISVRMVEQKEPKPDYLRTVLPISANTSIVLYASDPGDAVLTMRQRFDSEYFMMETLEKYDVTLIIKTHPQDNGNTTLLAYRAAGRPRNVILLGDESRGVKMCSDDFVLKKEFDFHSALADADYFVTQYSTAALEAVYLGSKVGILDLVGHGYFLKLTELNGAKLIRGRGDLAAFVNDRSSYPSQKALEYYGLYKSAYPTFVEYYQEAMAYLSKGRQNNKNKDNVQKQGKGSKIEH